MARRSRHWLDDAGTWIVRFLGIDMPERPVLELIEGTGVDLDVVDDPATNATKVTIHAAGGSGEAYADPIEVAGSGTLNNVASTTGGLPARALVFTGAPTLAGVQGGTPGRVLPLIAKGGPLTIAHEAATSPTVTRFSTSAGASVVIPDESTAIAVWDDVDSRWHIVESGGAPLHVGTGDFPTTGELARFGSSIGNGVFGNLLTWRPLSVGASRTLMSVFNDSGFADFVIGNISSQFSTYLQAGYQLKLEGTRQVWISAGSVSGDWGSGGIVLGSNVSIGGTPMANGYAGGSGGVVHWHNVSISPTGTHPGSGALVWESGGLHKHWWFFGERVQFGGTTTDDANIRNYGPSLVDVSQTGAARSEFLSRSGRCGSRTFYNEEETTSTAPKILFRWPMGNETRARFSWAGGFCRRTAATKAGDYGGKLQYRRTGGGAPVPYGAAITDTEQETTAGDGIAVNLVGNELQWVATAADSDPRTWHIEVHVHEITAA